MLRLLGGLALILASTFSFAAAPTITGGISTGNDGFTIHLQGTNFQADSYVDTRAACGGSIIESYTGSLVRVVDTQNIYLTVTDPTQRSLLTGAGEYFWVVNPTPTGTWSSCQLVKWASPPPPLVFSAASEGSDGYTIHLKGEYFHSDSSVDVRATYGGPVIYNFSGSNVSITNDSDITFYISDPTQRASLNSTGLWFFVVNLTPTPATWTSGNQVIRTASNISYYDSLASPLSFTGTQSILTRNVSVTTPTHVLISADGSVSPGANSGISFTTSISVDGVVSSDLSKISWINSVNFDTHAFNTIGTAVLQPGTHVIKLSGTATAGSVTVGATTNLSTMLTPATTIVSATSTANVGPLNFNTYTQAQPGNNDRSPNPMPHPYTAVTSATVPVTAGQPLVLLGSGYHYQAGHDGDSAIGFWVDSTQSTSYTASWDGNDICTCAEQTAPFYLQGIYSGLSAGNHQALLGGSELYWSDQMADNPIIYDISSGASLLAMTGFHTAGALYSPTPLPNAPTSMLNTIPIFATTPTILASGTVNVPSSSSGVLYFAAKTRLFGGSGNATLTMQIYVDGVAVGSKSVQTCGYNLAGGCISARTMTASYLSAGAGTLSIGNHNVQVQLTMQTTTSGQKMYGSIDAPLIWFD